MDEMAKTAGFLFIEIKASQSGNFTVNRLIGTLPANL
jgi:hypothetical protein